MSSISFLSICGFRTDLRAKIRPAFYRYLRIDDPKTFCLVIELQETLIFDTSAGQEFFESMDRLRILYP